MAAGVTATKGATEEAHAALQARIADLQRRITERDQELAWMADQMAAMTAAAEAQAPAAPEPTAKAALPSPAAIAFAKADAELGGLAIVAREGRTPASRQTWHGALVRLGKHIAPDLPPASQLAKALEDPRGHAFLQAKMEALQ